MPVRKIHNPQHIIATFIVNCRENFCDIPKKLNREEDNMKKLELANTVSNVCLAVFASLAGIPVAHAQDASGTDKPEVAEDNVNADILVTARRRDETSISVPVAVTAIGAQEIERRALTSIDTISRIVPSLVVANSSGGTQGGAIAIRGIASGETNPFADQAVSFNVDGAQIARSTVRRMAQMDLAQIEVLKGPQALFFGKNSPGGIVVIRTADPTPTFQAGIKGSYEVNGQEVITDGFISGPATESLGVRAAFFYRNMQGWAKNIATPSATYGPAVRSLSDEREYAGRVTIKFEPSDNFDARLKLGYNNLKTSGNFSNSQLIFCASGVSAQGGPDDCTADDRSVRSNLGPTIGGLKPEFRDGIPFVEQEQTLASLEMNYHPSEALTLTSLSTLYDVDIALSDNANSMDTTNVNRMFASYAFLNIRELSQELRLASDFEGPLNFMMGGYYQNLKQTYGNTTALGVVTPTFLGNQIGAQVEGEAYSAFGQLMLKPVEQIEISAGGRYSKEKKHFLPFSGFAVRTPITTVKPRVRFDDFSPEVTVTWRPSANLTVYGAYKEGFLSGGFNANLGNYATDRSYAQQNVDGFEGGIKARLLDGSLRTDLIAYSYDIKGLQVSFIDATFTPQLTNAGKARVEGVEFSANWDSPVSGLSLRGSAIYNKSQYLLYVASCYGGQTIAAGCAANRNSSGVFTGQDLKGKALARAPKWTGLAGINYEGDVGPDLHIGLSVDANFTSQFFTDSANKPQAVQKDYALLDAAVRIGKPSTGIEIALIGRNLTNKYYYQRTTDNPITGSGTGTNSPAAVVADSAGVVSRGREIVMQVGFKF